MSRSSSKPSSCMSFVKSRLVIDKAARSVSKSFGSSFRRWFRATRPDETTVDTDDRDSFVFSPLLDNACRAELTVRIASAFFSAMVFDAAAGFRDRVPAASPILSFVSSRTARLSTSFVRIASGFFALVVAAGIRRRKSSPATLWSVVQIKRNAKRVSALACTRCYRLFVYVTHLGFYNRLGGTE